MRAALRGLPFACESAKNGTVSEPTRVAMLPLSAGIIRAISAGFGVFGGHGSRRDESGSRQAVRYFEIDLLPLSSATWASCRYVLFLFGISCVPPHVLWVKVLRRRRGGLAVLASALCLCWSVAELILRVHLL